MAEQTVNDIGKGQDEKVYRDWLDEMTAKWNAPATTGVTDPGKFINPGFAPPSVAPPPSQVLKNPNNPFAPPVVKTPFDKNATDTNAPFSMVPWELDTNGNPKYPGLFKDFMNQPSPQMVAANNQILLNNQAMGLNVPFVAPTTPKTNWQDAQDWYSKNNGFTFTPPKEQTPTTAGNSGYNKNVLDYLNTNPTTYVPPEGNPITPPKTNANNGWALNPDSPSGFTPPGVTTQTTPTAKPKTEYDTADFGFIPFGKDPKNNLPASALQEILVQGVINSGVPKEQAGKTASDFLKWLAEKNANKNTATPLEQIVMKDPYTGKVIINMSGFTDLLANATTDGFTFNPEPWKGDVIQKMREAGTGLGLGSGPIPGQFRFDPRRQNAGFAPPTYYSGNNAVTGSTGGTGGTGGTGTTGSNWTPQSWQSKDGVLKWDERDWGTVDQTTRGYIDAYLRAQGWEPSGQYGQYGPTEYKWKGTETPSNIFFDPQTMNALPSAIADQIKQLFTLKGWLPLTVPPTENTGG